ncbi:DUF1223 domain-containing protein [Phenylobacterium sp.]|uniref:DUF1223 domain-containing protein n=1 Tax=Phenylobacterium sp. TaxID=1871053 RepID=UPI002F424240
MRDPVRRNGSSDPIPVRAVRTRAALSAAFVLAAFLAGTAGAAPAEPPVVVELFTSQGCSSCPPANATLSILADRPDVLALSFGVTYWDDLGWKDTFASPQFTARQWSYARGLHHDDVATPQMVVQGRADTVGQTPSEVEPLIRAAKADLKAEPSIVFRGEHVTIAAAAARRPADVWLVRYDPRTVQVPVRRGENGGRTLPHRDVVRELTRLGAWNGSAATFSFSRSADPALRTAVLVQAAAGGPILAAAKG